MYNRYIRNDSGDYTRIREDTPEEDSSSAQSSSQGYSSGPQQESGQSFNQEFHQSSSTNTSNRRSDGLSGFLRHILDQFHLDSIDSGDLILLGLLFLLSRENADEELLIALGLLLIL